MEKASPNAKKYVIIFITIRYASRKDCQRRLPMQKCFQKISDLLLPAILLLIIVAMVVSQLIGNSRGNARYFSGEAEEYYKELIAEGFPEDYAVSLTELHLLHPAWSFVPLKVSETDTRFTWDYVIGRETEKGDVNVIYSSDSYSAYHHPTNRKLYDSGYYQASQQAVEYFMDPRNFLNETDIFQFYTPKTLKKSF